MSMYLGLESALRKELDKLEEKYRNGSEISEGDLRRIDLLAHSLKSLNCYVQKKESEEMQRMAYEGNGYYNPNTRYMEQNRQYQSYMPSDRRW